MATRRCAHVLALLVGGFILAACAPTATPAITPTPADTAIPTATIAPATETPVPTPTEEPLLVDPADLPSAYVGPLPEGAVARLGQGAVREVETSPDEKIVAIGTTTGMLVYDVVTLDLLWAAPTSEGVWNIAWTHDNTKLAAGLADGAVVVWEAQTGRELFNLLSDDGAVVNLDWTPDGRHLVSASAKGIASIRDGNSGALLHQLVFNEESYITHTKRSLTWMFGALSPDGKRYVTHYEFGGDDGPRLLGTTFVIWDIPSGRQAHVVDTENGTINSLVWSPDSKMLVPVSTYIGDSGMWDASTGTLIDPLGIPLTSYAYWSPDGTKIFAGGVVVEVASGKMIYQIPSPSYYYEFLRWSADSERFTVYDEKTRVTTFDARTGQALPPQRPALTQDPARYFLTTGANYSKVGVWDVSAGTFTHTLFTGTHAVGNLTWSPDGITLAATSDYGVVVWDIASGRSLAAFNASRQPALSPDGKTLAVEDDIAKVVNLLDALTGDQIGTIDDSGSRIFFLPDGHLVIGDYSGPYRVYDPATGQRSYQISTGGDSLSGLAWSADGKRILSVGNLGYAVTWDAVTGERQKIRPLSDFDKFLAPVSSISPDLSMLAIIDAGIDSGCSDVQIRLVDSGEIVNTIRDTELEQVGCPSRALWSPDGTLLVVTYASRFYRRYSYQPFVGEKAGLVAIYDTRTMDRLKVLRGHAGFISGLAFSPNGSLLATGSSDGSVILWDMTR